MAGLGLGTNAECPEAVFPHPLNYGGTLFYYIIIVSMGTFSFFSFGTSVTIFKFWRILVGLIIARNWPEVKSLVTDVKTYRKLVVGKSGSKVPPFFLILYLLLSFRFSLSPRFLIGL